MTIPPHWARSPIFATFSLTLHRSIPRCLPPLRCPLEEHRCSDLSRSACSETATHERDTAGGECCRIRLLEKRTHHIHNKFLSKRAAMLSIIILGKSFSLRCNICSWLRNEVLFFYELLCLRQNEIYVDVKALFIDYYTWQFNCTLLATTSRSLFDRNLFELQ